MEYADCSTVDELGENDLVVVLMGPTGTGKSNFIDNLTGEPGKRASSGMQSCTSTVGPVRIKNHPKYRDRIVVVDTPGFDDTNMTDLSILQIISSWLIQLFKKRVSLSAILYFHRITDIRMSGTHVRNLDMFTHMCGSKAVKNMVLVTTMWDEIDNAHAGEERETHLKENYWGPLLTNAVSIARFDNHPGSALELLESVVSRPLEKVVLQIQEEMVVLHRGLEETEAARKLEKRAFAGIAQPPEVQKKHPRFRWPSRPQSRNEEREYIFVPSKKPERRLDQYMGTSQARSIQIQDITPNDLVIAVMGPNGTGKSTFIDVAAGSFAGRRTRREHTADVRVTALSIPESKVKIVFVDIPGFDDADKSDAEILKTIADWLEKIYREKIILGGILYLHRISDNRIGSNTLRNLRIFEAICGQNAFAKTAFVTTMWEDVLDESMGQAREAQLKAMCWTPFLNEGAIMKRFERLERPSAFQIIEAVLNGADDSPLLIQQEMVDKGMDLNETSIGKKLCSDLKQLTRENRGLLQRIKSQLKQARKEEAGSLAGLREEYQDLKEISTLVINNMHQLDIPFGQKVARVFGVALGLKLR